MQIKHYTYLLPIIFLFLFSSCEQQTKMKKESKTEIKTEDLIENIKVGDFDILEIDNCEYIIYKKSPNRNIGFGFLAHKGNCKNPIHYHNNISLPIDTIQQNDK